MKTKVLLILAVFMVTVFSVSCSNNDQKIDVEKYRQKVRESRKGSAPIEQKKEVEKQLFPNLKDGLKKNQK